MKKLYILPAVFLFAVNISNALAEDKELRGTVANIDTANSNFTVRDSYTNTNMVVRVDQFTEFEVKKEGLIDIDYNVKFSDLRVNDAVKVDLKQNAMNEFIADDVEIYRK